MYSPSGTQTRWQTLPVGHTHMTSPDKGNMATFPHPAPVKNKGQEDAGAPTGSVSRHLPTGEGEAKWHPSAGVPGFSCRSHAPSHDVGGVEEQPGRAPCSTQSRPSLPPGQGEGRPPSLTGIYSPASTHTQQVQRLLCHCNLVINIHQAQSHILHELSQFPFIAWRNWSADIIPANSSAYISLPVLRLTSESKVCKQC